MFPLSQEETRSLPTPPTELGYCWRPASRDDGLVIHRLLLDIEAVDRHGRIDSLEERERDFADPDTDLEADTILAFSPQGELAALGWLTCPLEGHQDYMAYLWGEVHPHHRQRGLGSFVLKWMETRARQILTTRPNDLPHQLQIFCESHLSDRVDLFISQGFSHVRTFYRMRCDLKAPILNGSLPPGISLVAWPSERDSQALDAFNSCFAEHWGFLPLTDEIWRLWFVEHSSFRRDLSSLAVTQDGQVIGCLLSQVRPEETQSNGFQEGWIQELGVLKSWRGQGIGSAMLCHALRAYQAAGMQSAGLMVDTDNQSGALAIYQRLGFQEIRSTLVFRKTV
jgi:ribosomal protein S18 acetylase RimI-like enzyme